MKPSAQRSFDLGPPVDTTHNHFAVLSACLSARPRGVAVEFGVGSAQSTRLIAATMPVVGFDSFAGLPDDWRPGFPRGRFAAAPPGPIPHAVIVMGLFSATLPLIAFDRLGSLGLVHFDADLYSSTATALAYVGPYLRPGCFVVFDEWFGYPGADQHEQRAWREYTDTRPDLDWDVVGHGHEQWALRITSREVPAGPPTPEGVTDA